MNIDDYFFNEKKFNFCLANWRFWLTRCLKLDELWIDVLNEVGWGSDVVLSETDQRVVNAVEQQVMHARKRLEREKRKLLVWINQAPFGRRQS